MSNLITEASSWLQDSECKTGAIQERTQCILSKFKDYIKRNRIRKDRILMVSKKFAFTTEQINNAPELGNMESCAFIRLDGESAEYICKDSYESIMAQLNGEDE